MKKEKPSIFIGSSSNGLEVARAIKSHFNKYADVDIWVEGVFKLNQSFLESIQNAASLYEYAILVLTPDDLIKSRGKSEMKARDNVIFELGLFFGRLGARRAFVIREESVNILTDFKGITVSKFRRREDGNMELAVDKACKEILNAIEQSTKQAELSLLPSTALAIGYYENFISKVYSSLLDNKYKIKIDGKIREDLHYDSFSFTIIIPDNLSYVEHERLQITLRKKKLREILVETPYRDFPFYVRANVEQENTLDLFDIPTTLLSSKRAIQLIFSKNYVGKGVEEKELEKREIRNFKKTIELLLKDRYGDDFAKHIRIENPSYIDDHT